MKLINSSNPNGNATFLFLATLNTSDLRILDIRNMKNVHKVNAFHQHIHPHGEYGSWAHRAAILGDRVYISNWEGGVIIVDKQGLEIGLPPEEILLNTVGSMTRRILSLMTHSRLLMETSFL